MSEKLLQNTLAEATTEQGFPTKVGVPVQREVELEDGTIVTVESVTPDKMATILKSHFVTPGEKYQDNGLDLNGVVQNYNEEDEPEPEPEPGVVTYSDNNEQFANDVWYTNKKGWIDEDGVKHVSFDVNLNFADKTEVTNSAGLVLLFYPSMDAMDEEPSSHTDPNYEVLSVTDIGHWSEEEEMNIYKTHVECICDNNLDPELLLTGYLYIERV